MAFLRARFVTVAAVVAVLSAGAARADSLPSYWMWVNLGGEVFNANTLPLDFVAAPNGGTWTLDGAAVGTNGSVLSWSSEYDVDPFVTNNVSVINTTGVVQTYVVGVTSPIVPQLPLTNMNGSIGITITNDPAGSATLTSVAPNAVYTANLDGAPVQTLANDPYSLTCAPGFCSTTQSFSFGSPVPIVGPGATTTMGITLRFTLSPGDQASITSVFNIIAVPEPVTGSLLGLGLLGLAVAGRKRS